MLLYPGRTWSFFPDFDDYLRFVTINFGMEGMLTVRSPKEMIEGYTDPLVEELNATPVYMGGDQTSSSFLAIKFPPTTPTDNRVTYLTGEDNYLFTR